MPRLFFDTGSMIQRVNTTLSAHHSTYFRKTCSCSALHYMQDTELSHSIEAQGEHVTRLFASPKRHTEPRFKRQFLGTETPRNHEYTQVYRRYSRHTSCLPQFVSSIFG